MWAHGAHLLAVADIRTLVCLAVRTVFFRVDGRHLVQSVRIRDARIDDDERSLQCRPL
jgi:hypothetical protein